MGLLKLIRDSVYSPAFYRELFGKRFSFSLKYFYSLVVVVALVLTIVFSIEFIPQLHAMLGKFVGSSVELIPPDVTVRIDRGVVSVNQPEPYVVPVPSDLKEYFDESITSLLVIDTSRPFDVEQFKSYHAYMWVLKDSFALGSKDDVRVRSFTDATDVVLNKEIVASFAEKLKSLFKWIPAIAVFGIFIWALFMFSFVLAYLLVGAIFVWGVARLRGVRLGYGASYRVGLHAITGALIIHALQLLLLPRLPFRTLLVYTVVLIAVTWCNVKGDGPVPEAQLASQATS